MWLAALLAPSHRLAVGCKEGAYLAQRVCAFGVLVSTRRVGVESEKAQSVGANAVITVITFKVLWFCTIQPQNVYYFWCVVLCRVVENDGRCHVCWVG